MRLARRQRLVVRASLIPLLLVVPSCSLFWGSSEFDVWDLRQPYAEELQLFPLLAPEDHIVADLRAKFVTAGAPTSLTDDRTYAADVARWRPYRIFVRCTGGEMLIQENLDLGRGKTAGGSHMLPCSSDGTPILLPSSLLTGAGPDLRAPRLGDRIHLSVVPQRTEATWVVLFVAPSIEWASDLKPLPPIGTERSDSDDPRFWRATSLNEDPDITCEPTGIDDAGNVIVEFSFYDSDAVWHTAAREFWCGTGFDPEWSLAVSDQWGVDPPPSAPIYYGIYPRDADWWQLGAT